MSPTRFAMAMLAFAALFSYVQADFYCQNPPGANGRNQERNDNRQNANRLYDTQNNAAGGYGYAGDPTKNGAPDPIVYYKGSHLRTEWTNQHACGPNENSDCVVVIQYACEADMPGIRDGWAQGNLVDSDPQNPNQYTRRAFSGTGGQNAQGTARIPSDRDDSFYAGGSAGGQEFGYHESIFWYRNCTKTERNKGLYLADQKLNRDSATHTRQNPNGNRNGLECAEERDYYPYWRPTQWRDAAVLTNKPEYCSYFQENSENVQPRYYCDCGSQNNCENQAGRVPISAGACQQRGGVWRTMFDRKRDAPDCRLHAFGRDNHLGNTLEVDEDGNLILGNVRQPETAHYNLVIPDDMEGRCVLRFRYNISTGDYPSANYKSPEDDGIGFSKAHNCPRIVQNPNSNGVDDGSGNTVEDNPCLDKLTSTSRPLYNRPYVQIFEEGIVALPKLSLAINTHQTGRTFQDRTHVFMVKDRPGSVGSSNIWNLNVRGRRGNIVQAYPAVEYDFVPSVLEMTTDDVLHIQVWGRDFNAAKNPNNGEGWRYSCRSNFVEVENAGVNYPEYQTNHRMFANRDDAIRWALMNQKNCREYEDGDDGEQNDRANCGKLNDVPARFPVNEEQGLVQVGSGHYHYVSTRNNNFSNRSHKGQLIVEEAPGLSTGAIIGIALGCAAAVGLLGAGVMVYGKRNPNTIAGGWYDSFAQRCLNKAPQAPPPQMDYQRNPGRI